MLLKYGGDKSHFKESYGTLYPVCINTMDTNRRKHHFMGVYIDPLNPEQCDFLQVYIDFIEWAEKLTIYKILKNTPLFIRFFGNEIINETKDDVNMKDKTKGDINMQDKTDTQSVITRDSLDNINTTDKSNKMVDNITHQIMSNSHDKNDQIISKSDTKSDQIISQTNNNDNDIKSDQIISQTNNNDNDIKSDEIIPQKDNNDNDITMIDNTKPIANDNPNINCSPMPSVHSDNFSFSGMSSNIACYDNSSEIFPSNNSSILTPSNNNVFTPSFDNNYPTQTTIIQSQTINPIPNQTTHISPIPNHTTHISPIPNQTTHISPTPNQTTPEKLPPPPIIKKKSLPINTYEMKPSMFYDIKICVFTIFYDIKLCVFLVSFMTSKYVCF